MSVMFKPMPSSKMASIQADRSLLAVITLASVAALAGCLVPEKFTAKVDVEPDASYTFRYSGTVMHALAAAQIKQVGSLSPKDDAKLRAETERMTKDKDVRKADYKGSGRYDIEVESHKVAGQPLRMFDIFSVKTDKDGVMTVASSELKDKEKRDLMSLGIAIDGTLEVRVPKNAQVVSSNATSTPTLGFGAYSWKIGQLDQRPEMKLKFK